MIQPVFKKLLVLLMLHIGIRP